MKKPLKRSAAHIYRLLVTVVVILLLVSVTLLWTPSFYWVALVILFFVAFQYNFPLSLLNNEINLIHIIAMGGGLLYGPVVAGWSTALGIWLGYLIRRFNWFGQSQRSASTEEPYLNAGYTMGLQVIPLIIALFLSGGVQGIVTNPGSSDQRWLPTLLPLALYAIIHSLLFLVDFLLSRRYPSEERRRGLLLLALVEVLPLPFILIAVVAYPLIGIGTLIILGSIPAFLAVFIYEFNRTHADLERRVQELSTLNQISRVLRSTLDLENLLTVIQVQVTQLLAVDNFYVALYDPNEQRLWYPLAVKHGKRQHWAQRPLMPDRLTDRVINEGKHILLSPSAHDAQGRIGLPSSEESPQAWMGVPLITSDHTIGCLAVFSASPDSESEFTQADLNLLTILSGQVSVAIENALLYEQTQRRAAQLETLNRISSLITASLDPQEVLAQVCRSVTQVGGGQRSAIFLLDPDKGQVFLAHAHGLSSDFSHAQESFSVTNSGRMRCLRSGRPVLTPALSGGPLEMDQLELMQQEGIQAYGEFPLTTPDGHIGFLSVYFDAPHTFRSEEVELLQTFATQAAMAVSNARLYAHVDMALSRRVNQLSILETVGRELSAAISSERLFEMILSYALDFTNSPWGELSLFHAQERTLTVKASRGYKLSRTQFSIRDGLAGRAVNAQQAINVGDVRLEPAHIDLTEGLSRSQLSIPLIHEGRVLGVLTLESDRLNAYTTNDQAFISQLATQAAVAVVNAELYSETQRRLREQSILYLVSTRLVGNPNLESVMQTLARSMEAALQTSSVGIYLWDDNESTYQIAFNSQSPSTPDCILPETVLYADLETYHPSLVKTGPLRISPKRGKELLGDCEDCQALVFPLIASKQRLGMVLLHVPHKRLVQEEELQLLRAIVSQVSISMQNAMLFSDVTHGRDRLAAVLNSVGEGILMIDTGGLIVLANEFVQKITSLSREDLLNRRFSSLPEDALLDLGYTVHEAEILLQDLRQGQVVNSPKSTIKTVENKPERVLERTTSPVWGQSGRVIGWIIVLRDVTEEYQLAQARELITGTLVHDLRSPVSAVLSAVDVIEDVLPRDRKDDVMDQALRVAHNGATRVLGLIETLLDIARMQSGRMDLQVTTVDLGTLITNLLLEFAPQGHEYKVIICNEVPTDLPPVCLDQSKITRVLTNLMDNALKFTPAGGQVTVTALLASPDFVSVQISDTGPGIPDEYREKIFEQFTQIPGQHARRRGSGLGLTFCRMAVEAHGGRIWVESKSGAGSSAAKGSIFTFLLPIAGPPLPQP